MRKVFSTMVLAALTASMVWAQDGTVSLSAGELKLSGDIKTGLRADGDLRKQWVNEGTVADPKWVEKAATANIYGHSDNADDGSALRADITATYANGPFGFKINLRNSSWTPLLSATGKLTAAGDIELNAPQEDGLSRFTNSTYISNAYGWVDLFGEKVSVYGGLIDDGLWGTDDLGGGTDKKYDGVGGLRLAIKPVAGLSIGWALPFGVTTDGQINDKEYYRLDSESQLPAYRWVGDSAWQLFGHSVIGAGFSHDLFALNAALKLNGSYWGYPVADDKKTPNQTKDKEEFGLGMDILAGFKVTAVPKLLIIVDGEFKGLGRTYASYVNQRDYFMTHGDYKELFDKPATEPNKAMRLYLMEQAFIQAWLPTTEVYAKLQYQILEPLAAGLRFHIKYYGGIDGKKETATTDDDLVKSDFEIRLYADYAVSENIIPGLEIEAAFRGITETEKEAFEKNEPIFNKTAPGLFDALYFKPRCTFKMGDNIKFNVWDKITLFMADGATNYYNEAVAGGGYIGKKPEGKPFGKEKAGWVTNTLQLDFIWSF